ncbi:hypothetical protein TNIN_204641 [Trichonephila inaurata madagascariensis]|uniref:Uncharacterized protein n=1 Tax=Trichonephila inaurata madagascariensis TaxID=2747483 RepID=A0A8X6Y4B4_9ARAC|nr:hypothetical protein TNIN_204641 [Trichonephila inaurata madagascariensis]
MIKNTLIRKTCATNKTKMRKTETLRSMCSIHKPFERKLIQRACSTNTCTTGRRHMTLQLTSLSRYHFLFNDGKFPFRKSKTGELFSGEPGFLGMGSSTGGLNDAGAGKNFLQCT